MARRTTATKNVCPKAGDRASQPSSPVQTGEGNLTITLVSFYSQKNQSSTGGKKTRECIPSQGCNDTDARTRTISFPPSPRLGILIRTKHFPFLFTHPFFFCISLYPWKASLLESTWHACSLRFLGRPLVRRFLQLLLCPASGLSTMHAQSYLITKRPRKRTLGLPRENVRNFRTYLLSIVFVPFSFYFVVGFLAFGLRHAFRSYLDPRKRYASCGEKILGRRRICGIVDNVASFRETRLVFASTNSRGCVRAYSRVDSQRDGIWPDFASTRKGL